MDEIRFQGSHVASQHQQQGRSDGNNNHTYLFVNAQDNRADTGEPLINRGGIGDEEHKNYDAGEKPHGRALKALFKKLGHGFDIVPPGDFPGTVCQHQPGQKGAENRVPNAHQHAPKAIAPAGAPRVADEHHRREVGRAIGERGYPRPGAAASHGEGGHVRALARVEYAHRQHEDGVYADNYPDRQLLVHWNHPQSKVLFIPAGCGLWHRLCPLWTLC